jgi:GTP cyclohydrolase I
MTSEDFKEPKAKAEGVSFPDPGAAIIHALLQELGLDPDRGGLVETPERVIKAWREWTSGYRVNPGALLKTFEDGAENVDEMVLVGPIEFYSHCEHHLAPFFGQAWIGYIPKGKIVGLSKLARVTDAFAKRLQVQERLTTQIADCIEAELDPMGVGVVLKAKHMCMCSRGVGKQAAETVTSAMRGVLRHGLAARAEFLGFVKL